MKLHLPSSLRKALMAVLASSAYFTTAEAGCMHAGVSPTIYTDFGQNMARYSVYQVNELLTAITARDGILIPYTTGAEPGKLEHKMISFEGMNNDGAFTAVGYNYTATVAHNGCPNPSFTPRYIGDNQAIHYQGVEYRSSQNKAFLLQPSIDYKLTRSSKIFTDITASGVFDVTEYLRSGHDVTELVHYRAGAGSQEVADFEGNTHGVAGGYAYITGGVVATLGFSYQGTSDSYPIAYDYTIDYEPGEGPRDGRDIIDDPYTISVHGIQDYGPGGAGQPTADNPKVYLLPFVSRGGDSGSPVWAWDAEDEEYKLISCHQARGGDNSYSRGASSWTIATMESFNQYVDMEAAGHTVHMFGAEVVDGRSKHISDSTNHVETTTQFGHIAGVAGGFQDVYFCGVGSKVAGTPVYTWLSLYDLKDTQNWYSYGNTYFNANGNGSGKQMHLGDLFNTENIVFESSGGAVNHIVLDEDVDMGIGYAQFTVKEAGQTAVFNLESKGKTDGRDYMLNSAGYIVDEGAQLHIKVTNTQEDANGNAYFREWRKQGAGDMYLEGQGNNEIFLNLGGKGTTYLHETDGYAAYNVLINNGATVNFNGDITQIARDVTFGNGGGFLEFSGLSEFTWESGENTHVEADGFTINALTQDAKLINSAAGTTTTLRYVTPGNTTFLGSFQDTANSNLNVIYAGGGTWTLNSIHTKLHAGSKFTVADGTVELVGTNTVHALGSIEGKAGTRYSHPDDWHYADSAMNVEVQSGATFRLGSHARLTGNVNVLDGGTLEIAEGVKHRYEYIEGWLIAEDTYQQFYRDFYGLKGNVTLNGNSTLRFNFSSGTDAENVYGYNISGSGNVDMQLGGSGATLVLSGTNNFTGTKHLAGGGLVAEAYTALGNTTTEKWHVNKDAFIAVKGKDGNTALTYIDGDSTGVLALTQDQAQQVNLNGTHHENMFVGALAGQVVQYGDAPKTMGSRTVYTETALDTVTLNGNKYWQLGGGGGELVVNFLLDDPDSQLVLGNEYTTGTVTLTNAWNRIGSIFFAGKVTLNYTSEEALGGSKISLDYTNRVAGSASVVSSLTRHSSGAMMMDGMEDISVDLTDHKELFLGAEGYVDYTGTITPDGGAYRFGGITGTLVINQALANQTGEQTNLIVDAQTYSGGTLALAAQASITGDVSVMGYDATRPGVSGGDIALRLDANNAIASAHSVTLKEGGILDVNGTSQTLHRFNMEAGSLLTDTSAAWNGTVTLEVEDGATSELRGGVEVNTLVKDGAGSLLLAGDNAYGTLLINNGTVNLLNGNSMSASGVTMVEANGILNLAGGFDVTGSVAFAGGKAMVAGKTLNGSIMVGTDGDGNATSGTLEQEGSGVSSRINSSVEVAEGSTLNLKGTNGTFVLTATDINESGGTIALDGHYLTINRGGEDPVNVGGTISLKGYTSGSNRATLYSDGSANNMVRNINELHIAGGNAAIEEASWNTIWNIHSLTGEGDLLWNSHTSHWFSSQLYLDGANDYAGKFTAQRTNGGSSDRKYQAYVELSHDLAAQYMDVDIKGQNDNNYMSLAINTDNATMKSLSGNQYAVLYAGAANPGTDQEHEKAGEKPLNEQPVSTRSATLTLTGTQDATFSGIVNGGSSAGLGFSIVKNGSATQTFSGSSVTFNDVEVHGGRLLLTSEGAAVRGNVTLATGTELSVGSWTLDSEHLLTVYGDAEQGSAKFTSAITMEGGTIGYSGLSLGTAAPALELGSVVAGTSHAVTINFSDSSAIQAGTTYYLANGDWSGVTISEESGDLGYMKGLFTKGEQGGLYVNFTMVGGSHVWDGDDSAHEWTSSRFGKTPAVFDENSTAVFTDSALNNEVLLADNLTVNTLNFASSETYTVHAKEGTDSKVHAASLVQSGSGTTTVSGDVVIGTEDAKGTISIQDGELVLQSADTIANVNSVKGEGTLGIGFSGASDMAIFHTDDRVNTLHLLDNVSYTANADQYHYLDVILDSGSTFTLGSDKHLATGAVTTNGDGATIALQNNSLFATAIVLGGDLNLSGTSGSNKTGTLNAAVNGSGHTVNASGTLVIGNKAFNADLNVAANGKVTLKNGAYDQIGTVTLGNSSILQVELGAGISNGATINMGDGASLQMINGNGINQVNANIVMAGNSASITGSYSGNGTYLEGTITGQGTLNLARENNHNNAWRLDSVIKEAEGQTLALSIDSNVTLTAANSYTGGTTIAGSTVQVNNQNALGTGGVTVNGGTLKLNSNLNTEFVNGSGGTLQLNGKTLVLTENETLQVRTFAGTVAGTGSILKQGGGSQAFSKAADLANVTVSGGVLQLSGGSASGKVTVAQGAELRINDNDFTISSAVENAGTFAFSGAAHKLVLDPSGAFEQESRRYMDIFGDTVSGNGFAQGTAIKVFNNREGAEVKNIATVEYLGDTLQLDAVTGIATMGTSSSVYSVRKGTVTYDRSFTDHAKAADIQTFSLVSESSSAPATLQLNQGLANGVTILSAGLGGNVGIGEGVTLNQSQLDAQVRTTLTGTGTYALAQGAWKLPSNVVLGDKNSWTGVVRVSNFADNGVNFANLANANSWVEVYGMRSGYLAQWNGGNLSTNLILTNNPDVGFAMFMDNGSSAATHPVMTVSGTWKGDGTLRNGNTSKTLNLDLKFTGDIHEWTGKYEQMGSSSVLSFANKNGMVVNASFANSGKGAYSLLAVNDTTFNGTIEDAQMFTVKSDANATLAGAAKVMGDITIEENATLVNQGNTTLTGAVANSGLISNSTAGNLVLSDSATSVGCITNAGTLTLGAKLIEGNITNNGDIIISSLLWEQASGYEDARGNKTESGNGFATNSLSVYDSGVTIEGEGHIYYGGNDVTQEVMSTGAIQSAINHGTYYIKTTDDAVTYSSIVNASANHLEYIQFKTNDGASLRVDSSDGLPHLRTSQVVVNDLYTGTATLSMEDGSTLVVDSSCLARVAATANSSITLQLDATTPDTHMWLLGGFAPSGATVNVTGSGVLDIGKGQYNISTLNISGGTVLSSFAGGGGGFSSRGDVQIGSGGTLQLSGVDAIGWSGTNTKSISLLGDADAPAAWELGARQTLSGGTAINMNGNAVIRAMAGHTTGNNAPMLDAYSNTPKITATGTGNVVAVPLRMRTDFTFDVAANGELTLAGGTASGYRGHNVVKNGAGKLIFDELQVNFGDHTYTGALNINAGSVEVNADASFATVNAKSGLAITAGTTSITTYAGSNGAAISVASGAELAINGNSSFASTIANNGTAVFGSGITLTLNGSFDSEGEVYRDIATGTISANGNGLMSNGYVTVLNGSGNVVLNGNVTVNYDGKNYTLQTDGRAYLGSDSSTYYVRTDTAVYNSAVAAESSIKTVALSGSATLDMQAALAEGVEITSTGGTVKIEEGVLFSRDSLTANNATTLAGSGTYALDLAKGTGRGSNVSFGNDWSGTVRLTGATDGEVNLNTIANRGGNSYATLEMAGATASLATGEINAPIVLTNPQEGGAALTVTNSGNFTFKGAISGSGDMVNTASSTYTFSGANLSGWNGSLVNNGTLNVNISGMESGGAMGAALVGVNAVSYTGATVQDTYTVAALETHANGTTLTGTNGTLVVGSLTGSGALTIGGSVELAGGEYEGSTITVDTDATLHLNGVQAHGAVLSGAGTVKLAADQVTVAGVTASSRIEAEGEGSHTLEIAGEGTHSSNATIGTNVDLVMSGEGSQTFNGDLTAFNGAVDVLSGKLTFGQAVDISSLTMKGGEIGLADGSSLSSARVASGAQASINAQNGTIALDHAIMNSGALTLAGTIDASKLEMQTRDNGYIAVGAASPTKNGSGFATVQNAVEVVRNVVAGELHATNVVVTRGGLSTTLDSDGWARFETGDATNYDTYYLRDNDIANLSVTQIQNAAAGQATLNKIVFDNMEASVNLVVDTDTSLSLFKVNEDCTANLNISSTGSISLPNGYRGVDGFVKLSGEGTYSITNTNSLGKGVSLADGWQGTVALSGTANTLDLARRGGLWTQQEGQAASTVRLDGWTSALTDAGWETNAKVVLGTGGLTVQGSALTGDTAPEYAFNGNVSGTGSITNSRAGAATFTFADVEGWSGSFIGTAGESTLNFNTDSVAASIVADGGKVAVMLNGSGMGCTVSGTMDKTESGALDVCLLNHAHFTGSANVSSLFVNESTTAAIYSNFTTGNISSTGYITVVQGSLTVTEGIEMLASTIDNEGGTIAFTKSGTVVNLLAGGDFDSTASSYKDINETISEKGNGFHIGGNVQIISNSNGGSITGCENVTVKYDGLSYQLLETGELYNADDIHTYYIHTGTVAYSSVKGAEGLVGLHLDSTLKPDASATLNLDADLASTVTNGIVSDGGTISIAQGVTLEAASLRAQGDTKLTGQGTYDLGSGVTAFAEHVSLSNDWNGIVRISDAHMSPFTFSNYANNHSSVEVLGISGWWNTGVRDFNGKLILGKDDDHPEKVALKLTDASSNYTYSLNGGVSGEGDYVLAYDSGKRISATTHTIKGDVSNWTGSFIDAVAQTNTAHTATLHFENNTAVNGVVNIAANVKDQRSGREDHKFNVEVVANQGSVHMTGNIEGIDKLTFDPSSSGRTLTIDSLATNDNGTTLEYKDRGVAGTIAVSSLSGSGTLTLHNNNRSSDLANFALNGGDYAGARIDFIAMKADYSAGARCVLLTLGDENVAKDSVIHTTINKTGTAAVNVGIAVNDDIVRVGGLTDTLTSMEATCTYTLVSGNPTETAYGFESSDGKTRTLVISGKGGTTQASVGGNLNLTMDSENHIQTFAGNMLSFNGDLDVKNGTLAISAPFMLTLHAVNVEQGAVLSIGTESEASDLVTPTQTIINNGTFNLSGMIALDSANRSHFDVAENGEEHFDGQDTYEGSGYLTTTTKYYLVKGGDNSTLNTEAMTLAEGVERVTDWTNSKDIVFTFTSQEKRGGTYYVNASYAYDETEMGGATAFIVNAGATLSAVSAEKTGAVAFGGTGTVAVSEIQGGSGAFSFTGVEGDGFGGTLSINRSGADYGQSISLQNFNGTLEFAGRFGLDNSSFGNAQNLVIKGDRASNNSGLQYAGSGERILAQNIQLAGANAVQFNVTGSSGDLVVRGDVAGGQLMKTGAGKMSFTGSVNIASLALNAGSVRLDNAAATYNLGTVTMGSESVLEVLNAQGATAQSVFVGDNLNATIKLGTDMTIAKGDGTANTDGALYTIGANHTLQINSADGNVHTLTVDKFDIANVGTKVNLQNTNMVVKGAATVGTLYSRNTNTGTMTVGEHASLTFGEEGSVAWSNGSKYVNLVVSGAVNVNGGETNKLHDVTLNGNGEINFAAGTATTIEGALSLAKTIDNSGSLTLSGTVALTGSLASDYELKETSRGYSGTGGYAGSGYEADINTYFLIKGDATGTVASTATCSNYGVELSVQGNNLLFQAANPTGTVYHVNKDLTYSTEEMGAASAIQVNDAWTLTGTMAEVTAKPFDGTGKVVVSNDIGDGTLTFNGVDSGFEGTLSLRREAGNHNKKLVLNNFNGSLEYAGRFELNGSNLGNAKQITFVGDRNSSNTGLWFHGNGTQTLTQDIKLTGEHDVQFEISDGNTNLIVSGDVTGNKLWKTNAGKMTLDGTVNVTSAKVTGGTLEFNAESTIGTYTINGGTTNFNANAAITTLGTENGSSGATVNIHSDVTVNATNFNNNWGIGTTKVDGTLNVAETYTLSTGGNLNTIKGSGTITAKQLNIANVGRYLFDGSDGLILVVGEGGITNGGNSHSLTMANGLTVQASNDFSVGQNTMLDGTVKWDAGEYGITISSVLSDAADSTGAMEITGGTVTLSGANTYSGGTTVTSGTLVAGRANALGAGPVTVNGGTLNLGGFAHTLETLNVNGGTVTTNNSGGSGCVSGTININAGGTFQVIGEHDAFGYNDNSATGKIAMTGTDENEARLVLNPSNHGSVTMKTNLELNGNAVIEAQNGASFNTYGCGISVSGTGNTISGMQVRSNVTVNTADGAELTVNSLAQSSISGSSGSLTKTGAGKLILDAVTIGNTATTVSAGTLALTQTVDAISGALTVNNGGTLKLAEYEDHAVTVGSLTLNSGAILDVSTLDFDTASTNPYTLMRGTTIATPVGVVVNFGLEEQVRYALTVDGSNNLVLTFVQDSRDLIWNGGSHNWSDTNWHTEASETPVSFNVKDNVLFDGTGGDATVILTEGTETGRMTLTNGGNTLTVNTDGHDLVVDELVSADAATDNKLTKSGAGTATFNGETAVTFAALNTEANGGTTIFNTAVNLVGAGDQYWSRFKSDVQFNKGVAMSGTSKNSYAFLVDNSATVTMGGTSDLTGYNIGVTTGSGKVVISDGAVVTANKFLNSSTSLGSNGILVVEDGGTINLNQLYATRLDLRGTVNVSGSIGDSKVQTLNAQGGSAKFSANTVTVTTLNASGGVETVIDNAQNLTVSAINFADNDTELTFKGHVEVTGGSRVKVGYNDGNKNNETATFEGGFDYTGNDDYALLIGNTDTVVLGGSSNWSGKTMGMETNGTLTLLDNATVTVGRVFNSGTASNNGTLVLGKDSTFSITGTSAANTISQLQNNGGTLEFANDTTLNGKVSGNGDISFNGTAGKTLTMNGDVSDFTGALQNTSAANLTVSLGASANQLYMNIASTGEGAVDLTMGGADYFLYGTQSVRNITQSVNKHMEVKGQGNVTATGTVQTGNFDVGTTAEETEAVFTLSGADAKLIYSGESHSYAANVRGYGTFAVVNGATQELTQIGSFHGTFAADGEGSVLTLSGTPASDVAFNATDGGVIRLTKTYTIGDDVNVEGGTVRVDSGLTVNGDVDLSSGTLEQHGGTVQVNADKSLTLGEASITSAISNSGAVVFTKDITATGLQESIAEVNVGANDTKTATANHFDGTRTESSIRVVSGDGTVTTGGHKVTQGDVAYTLQQDGTAVSVTESSVDYATFLQHEAGSSLNSSAITSTALQHSKFSVGVDVNNANLNVDSFLASVQATDANITNVANADYIQVLHIAGGSNTLTGSVSDLATMTQFAQGAESSLHIRGAETAQKAGAVVFHGSESERDVTITAAQATGEGYDIYALNNDRFTVESHKMVKVADGNITVGNHIKTDTVSTGETTGSLTLANGADAETLNEVIAAKGDVTFLNMAAENETATGGQTSISLNKLEIGAGKTVSFYEAVAPVSIDQLAQEASVSVVGTLTAGQGATLNADLVMEKGSTLDVRGTGGAGLLMGSEVTLNKGMTLSDYSGEWASWEAGTTYTLFTGVDGLDIGNGVTTGTMDYTQWVDAKEYFDNIHESNRYFLCYGGAPDQNAQGVLTAVNDGSNVGMVYIMAMPEPTTSTLSLLALAALAARRRRK